MTKILLFGDYITDRTHYCATNRLCPEAPVPVLTIDRTDDTPGGAALVAANLESLGRSTTAIYGTYSRKERFFVGNHLIVRVDADAHTKQFSDYSTLEALRIELASADIVVISDYCKGSVNFNNARLLVSSGKPCFVDTKNSHIEWFRGENVTLFPNQKEYEAHIRTKEHLFGSVVVKLGENGCSLWDEHRKGFNISTRKRQAADVTGAGDCFIAAFIHAKLAGIDPLGCCNVANEAAGASVEHVGTYAVKQSDLKRAQHLFDVAQKVCA